MWPPAVGAGTGDSDGLGEAGGKLWRAQVAAEWGRGDVTVGKVEVRPSVRSVCEES